MKPLLAVSMGDPAGIGPEVILKAACVNDVRAIADLAVFGDTNVLARASVDCDVPFRVVEISHPEQARAHREPGTIAVVPVSDLPPDTPPYGGYTSASDRAQVDYVKAAFHAVLDKRADALVTGPIQKAALGRAGVPWAGHTDMLADLSGVDRPVMMLAGPSLRVIPLTIHVPLKDVARLITFDLVLHTLRIAHTSLEGRLGPGNRSAPRIAVAGLNPHAGESGMFGDEEIKAIAPAIDAARKDGIDAKGPFPGDTVFYRAARLGEFDVVVGMYHDQALIPLKLLDFDEAVNVTLGLPAIRTSVDHGTAYDIAGKGTASPASMLAAIRLAADMAKTTK